MARVLFLFLDGVGLSKDDSQQNPFSVARMPVIRSLLEGKKLLLPSTPFSGDFATLLAIDACMGVEGSPQSATGQASIVSGRNVAQEIGGHYGPKPNPAINHILKEDNLFAIIKQRGGRSALLNAYPPRYFENIRTGRRLLSVIPLAVTTAGLKLMTAQELQSGEAMAADFTGVGWAALPNFPPTPIYTSEEAGALLARLSETYDLAWFDFWPTDYAGHRATMDQAVTLLESFDAVLGGLVRQWETRKDLIVLTSDHGNLENLDARGHTRNPVPALLIGPEYLRNDFAEGLKDLTDFVPAILRTLFGSNIPDSSGTLSF